MEKASEKTLEQSIKRVLIVQTIVAVALLAGIVVFNAVFQYIFGDAVSEKNGVMLDKLKACLYGSALAITGTILSARSVRRVSDPADDSGSEISRSGLVAVYSGLLNKLVIVGGGIALGLVAFGLEPVYVVIGYFIVQIATVFPMLLGDD